MSKALQMNELVVFFLYGGYYKEVNGLAKLILKVIKLFRLIDTNKEII